MTRGVSRVIGHADLANLAKAVERDLARTLGADAAQTPSSMPSKEGATLITV
jgi:hypothetical protein